MNNWFVFSLLSVFALAGAEISQKISLTRKVDISAITNNFYVWSLQGIIGLALAFAFGQFSPVFTTTIIIKLIFIGIIYFIGGTLFYTSYKGNSPSISIILGTVSVVFSSILGTIFLNDIFSPSKIIGIILILCAIVFLNFNKKEKINKYNVFAILGGLCFGVAFTIDKSFVINMSPFMYLGLMCLSVAVISLITSFKLIITESKKMVQNNFIPILFAGSFGSAFNLFTFYAYKYGANVGVNDAINNTSIFFVILLEIFLLKDKTQLLRKVSAAVVAILGVLIIGMNS